MERQVPISFTFLPRDPNAPNIPNIEVQQGGGLEGYGRGGYKRAKIDKFNLFGFLIENSINLEGGRLRRTIRGGATKTNEEIDKMTYNELYAYLRDVIKLKGLSTKQEIKKNKDTLKANIPGYVFPKDRKQDIIPSPYEPRSEEEMRSTIANVSSVSATNEIVPVSLANEKIYASEAPGEDHENYDVSVPVISTSIAENKAEETIVKLYNSNNTKPPEGFRIPETNPLLELAKENQIDEEDDEEDEDEEEGEEEEERVPIDMREINLPKDEYYTEILSKTPAERLADKTKFVVDTKGQFKPKPPKLTAKEKKTGIKQGFNPNLSTKEMLKWKNPEELADTDVIPIDVSEEERWTTNYDSKNMYYLPPLNPNEADVKALEKWIKDMEKYLAPNSMRAGLGSGKTYSVGESLTKISFIPVGVQEELGIKKVGREYKAITPKGEKWLKCLIESNPELKRLYDAYNKGERVVIYPGDRKWDGELIASNKRFTPITSISDDYWTQYPDDKKKIVKAKIKDKVVDALPQTIYKRKVSPDTIMSGITFTWQLREIMKRMNLPRDRAIKYIQGKWYKEEPKPKAKKGEKTLTASEKKELEKEEAETRKISGRLPSRYATLKEFVRPAIDKNGKVQIDKDGEIVLKKITEKEMTDYVARWRQAEEILDRICGRINPLRFTSYQFNINYFAARHVDGGNRGLSCIFAVGDYHPEQGSGLLVVNGRPVDIKYQPLLFNGVDNPHMVLQLSEQDKKENRKRCSFVMFEASGRAERGEMDILPYKNRPPINPQTNKPFVPRPTQYVRQPEAVDEANLSEEEKKRLERIRGETQFQLAKIMKDEKAMKEYAKYEYKPSTEAVLKAMKQGRMVYDDAGNLLERRPNQETSGEFEDDYFDDKDFVSARSYWSPSSIDTSQFFTPIGSPTPFDLDGQGKRRYMTQDRYEKLCRMMEGAGVLDKMGTAPSKAIVVPKGKVFSTKYEQDKVYILPAISQSDPLIKELSKWMSENQVPINKSRGNTGVGRSQTIGVVRQKYKTTYNDSRYTRDNPDLKKLLFAIGKKYDPLDFTSVQVNQNYEAKPHIDKNNIGLSMIFAVGDYQGGYLYINDTKYDISKNPLIFNGSQNLHYVSKITSGDRYSFVYFRTGDAKLREKVKAEES